MVLHAAMIGLTLVEFLQLNITPGQKGLVQLTGDVPSWINFQDREKAKVLLLTIVTMNSTLFYVYLPPLCGQLILPCCMSY